MSNIIDILNEMLGTNPRWRLNKDLEIRMGLDAYVEFMKLDSLNNLPRTFKGVPVSFNDNFPKNKIQLIEILENNSIEQEDSKEKP